MLTPTEQVLLCESLSTMFLDFVRHEAMDELLMNACGSVPLWAHCRNTRRGCCSGGRIVARLTANGDVSEAATGRYSLRTPRVIES